MHGEPWTGRKLVKVLLSLLQHTRQAISRDSDCITGVVRIQMASINKTSMECACVHT